MELSAEDVYHLRAAQGWFELGASNDAFDELDRITPENRGHPEVLKVRCHVYIAAKKWVEAETMARGLTTMVPEEFEGWWMRSFALHELKRTREAYENLAGVRDRFTDEWLTHYNLACYLTQLGRLDEARASLERALKMNPDLRAGALEDRDLEPLWTEIQRK